MKEKCLTGIRNVSLFNKTMIYCSYIVACFYPFFHYKLFGSFFEHINLNYFIAIFTILSFDYTKITRLKFCLWIILPICLVFRNWLMLWTVITTAYQLIELRIPVKNLAMIGLCIVSLQLFGIVEANLFEIVESNVDIVEKTNRKAYDLGLGNSNNVGTTVFYFISLLYLTLFRHHKKAFYLIAIAVDLLMFYISSSRTFFLSGLIIILLAIGYQLRFFKNWMKSFLGLTPTILVCFLVYIILNYTQSENIKNINDIATGRIYLFALFFKDFSSTDFLLGKPIELTVPLDNTFLAILHTGGLICIIFYCLSFYLSFTRCFYQLRYYIPFLLGMFAASMTESLFGSPSGAGLIVWMIALVYYFDKDKRTEATILY